MGPNDCGRSVSAQLNVGTPDGPAPAGTSVRYALERHACRFGVNIHHWGLLPAVLQSSLEEAVQGLANVATVPFYWGQSLYDRLPPYEPGSICCCSAAWTWPLTLDSTGVSGGLTRPAWPVSCATWRRRQRRTVSGLAAWRRDLTPWPRPCGAARGSSARETKRLSCAALTAWLRDANRQRAGRDPS
jgi:hypothetical protein